MNQKIQSGGLRFKVGPFNVQLRSDISGFHKHFLPLYGEFELADSNAFIDFDVSVTRPKNLRRWLKPQVIFNLSGRSPFLPLPISQALPIFEWGLNWCIAHHAHQYLQFHAAGLVKDDVMVIMPAPPGSGKSTLTAALMNHGWRLLSDEIVMIDLVTREALAISRPINLKNNSIDLMRSTFPTAYLSDKFFDTAKGTVALMAPTAASVARQDTRAMPTHIIYPRYINNQPIEVTPLPKAQACLELINNSFNYHFLGETGFATATQVVNQCQCFELKYSRLSEAFDFFDGLTT